MELKRKMLPSYFLPVFMIWVALTNIGVIITAIALFSSNIAIFGSNPGLILGIVITINVASIILLYPLFNMDPIKPFLIPALIWFAVVAIIYIIMGMYWLLIFSFIQLGADLWFEWMSRRIIKKST